MASTGNWEADPPDYSYNATQPSAKHGGVVDSKNNTPTSQQLPAKPPFYRRRNGIVIIILIIIMGVIVGGAVGGTKVSAPAAQHNLNSDSTTLPVATGITATTTLSASTTTITTTSSAPSPSQSNCVWEGTAPLCDGKCHTSFTQMKEDNCGDGECCWTGFKVYCCQE